MKRLHLHVAVPDLAQSIGFYATLFGAQPTVVKDDYAKWMLDDPRINFAISNTGRAPGIDHLGLQVDSGEALAALGQRLQAAGGTVVPEEGAVCCYARSDKAWTEDPQGTRWETFHTLGDATRYSAEGAACATTDAACAPAPAAAKPKVRLGTACCPPQSGCC